MRAFLVNEYAHPAQVSLTFNAPEPTPAKDQVLVDVFSAGLNFFDVRNVPTSSVPLSSPGLRCLPRFSNAKESIKTSHHFPSS